MTGLRSASCCGGREAFKQLLTTALSLAAVFPLFGTQMYEGMGYQWASTLIAFLTLVMAPFPWIFFKYGKRIRAKSRYAKS